MAIVSPRATGRFYERAPVDWIGHPEEWVRKIADILNNVLEGKINATGSVTLTASSATTTLTDARIGPNTVIAFMPTTSNAAAGVTALYVSARTEGSATLTHANNAQIDRTYGYSLLG